MVARVVWDHQVGGSSPSTRTKKLSEIADFRELFLFLVYCDARGERYQSNSTVYMKYCELLGCKELTSTFCMSDDRVYGNMCGITFERHGTIGRGSDKCDFYFYMG